MQDKYQIEYWTKDGKRVGIQISAYCSQDVIDYAEQLPNYYLLAKFPEKTDSN